MTVRVVIADDSEIAQELVKRTLQVAPGVQVVGGVKSVDELVKSELLKAVDVVVLDLWMPGRTGLGAIREIAAEVPVVVVSNVAKDSALAREALAQGARAFIAKASLQAEPGRTALRKAVERAAGLDKDDSCPVVLVVGSTGAMPAVALVVPEWCSLTASFLFLQHMPEGREEAFAHWICNLGLPARPAVHDDELAVGTALVAPGGRHMLVNGEGTRVVLKKGPLVEGHRPSASRLIESAASLGFRAIVVVLSGLGSDGAAGVAAVLEAGGRCFVQEPRDCVAPSMPRAALKVSPKVRRVALQQLGPLVRHVIRRAGGG